MSESCSTEYLNRDFEAGHEFLYDKFSDKILIIVEVGEKYVVVGNLEESVDGNAS